MLQEVMRPTGRKEISNLKAEDKSEIIQTSIPNRPREISKEVIPPNQEQSGEDMEKRMKHKPECAEDIQQQDCHSRSGKDDKRITQSFEPHHSLLFQPKSSPKHETTVSVVLGKDKTSSTKEDQKVAEDPRGEHSTKSNFFYAQQPLIWFSATLTEPSFSNSGQIKTSSSEERRKPLLGTSTGPDYADLNLVQRTLHSMAYRVVNGHVLPLEKQQDRKSNLTLQEKEKLDTNRRLASDKESTNTDRPSPPPNPFSLETFDMGFKATLCVGLGIRVPSVLKLPQRHRHGPYPILRLGVVQHDAFINLDCRRIRIVPEPTVIDPLPPPPLNIRIPWRGKNILVKFPPAKPAAVLPLRRTESLEQ